MCRLGIATALALWTVSPVLAAGWGSVEGQFVVKGDLPAVKPLVEKGNPAAKDAAVCAVQEVPNDSLAFDPATKGVQSVFVYLRRAPAEIHPDLKASAHKEVEFDQKGCRFLPHGMVVRTDQVVVCKSSDGVAHNLHTNPLANTPQNFIVQPNDQKGAPVSMPSVETLPVKIQCDIHPWMLAWWVVVDHPYAAVTDKTGHFKIENLPEGEHEFRLWHEQIGYVDRKLMTKYTVHIKAGETTKMDVVEIPADLFQAK